MVKSIQNPLGKMATHALPRLTMDVIFPVLLLESPTSCRKRISILEVHAVFDNRDDTYGLFSFSKRIFSFSPPCEGRVGVGLFT